MQIKIPTEIMSQIQKQTVFRSHFFFFFGCSKSYHTLHIKTFDLLRFSIPLTSSKFCFKPKITSSVPIIMELFLEQSKCILENILLRLFSFYYMNREILKEQKPDHLIKPQSLFCPSHWTWKRARHGQYKVRFHSIIIIVNNSWLTGMWRVPPFPLRSTPIPG